MLNDRDMYLLNAGIDGELTADEQGEHDTLLERSGDARAMRAELQKLANVLEALPEQSPPLDMAQRILDQAAPSSRWSSSGLSGFFSSFQPATAGVAFAAGLLITVAAYEWAPDMPGGISQEQMVGTLIANRDATHWQTIDSRDIDVPGLRGHLALRQKESDRILSVELKSEQELEVRIQLEGSEASLGGVYLHSTNALQGKGHFEFTGGAVNVVSKGGQTFEIYLPVAGAESAGNWAIGVGISAGEVSLFDTKLGG